MNGAPAGTQFPKSDPAPPGGGGRPRGKKGRSWRGLAQIALARKAPAHLTLIDAEGFRC
ncbi:MAG: hypothetical protein R3E09_11335 [Novosphingobium sp.]